MPQLKTPGVYTKETAVLAPSVAEVATAIPVFIGYTETAVDKEDGLPKPIRISSMLEFTETFGGAYLDPSYTVAIDENEITDIEVPDTKYTLSPSLDLFYRNGGGVCYVISLGDYDTAISAGHFDDAITVLDKYEQPTLIVLSDAINLPTADYHALIQSSLLHCSEMDNRFCIFDVLNSNDDGDILSTEDAVANFRNGIGNNNLKYGASYYPYLQTTLTHAFDDKQIKIAGYIDEIAQHITDENGVAVYYSGNVENTSELTFEVSEIDDSDFLFANTGLSLTVTLPKDESLRTPGLMFEAWQKQTEAAQGDFDVQVQGAGNVVLAALVKTTLTYSEDANVKLIDLKYDRSALYNDILSELQQQRMVMPPSSAIAGIYANTDSNFGVWQAPANISVSSVIEPIRKINNKEQENLNVDVEAGKSINVIRSFTSKGHLVWGGRTLAGNDNEWRYINVRRLFNMVKASLQKATGFAVFQPNTPITWLKVRAMMESYLEDLWQAGGLVGATKEEAFFVKVGKGITMNEDDILNGRMNIEVGLRASRPAEFITINFTHHVQDN
ncbi:MULTISPECIES: phage tail sheath C-terminal domain-containing protein [unclassified Moritella]|uniref:phage tail sheath family protein n=1 Tax=unclassified Moritella TaxID=2637987 RepID=UPI002106AE25|nr:MULTISPECIES: phage tail sheath C-terminal domain-containing protein [unclassified Moritella]